MARQECTSFIGPREAMPYRCQRRGWELLQAGSFGALALSYFNSGTYKGHAAETRRSQRDIINGLVQKHGDKP